MNLKKKFVVGAASVALIASMGGVPAMAVDDVNSLPGFVTGVQRLAGMDRIGTSLDVADHEFGGRVAPGLPTTLYIASGADANMVDAAAAGMLQDGPIAYVTNNSYVATAVGQHFAAPGFTGYAALDKVVAIGGTAAISDATLKTVADELGISSTSRLAGKDRYETSVAIAEAIYKAAANGDYADRVGRSIVSPRSNLNVAYLANGADNHVVDSMVAGTLDNGPVLLVKPDGSIPESVAEFIKASLPEQFAALGGTAAVADKTVQEAWIIKTLANKWDTSYSLADLTLTRDQLDGLVNGTGTKGSRDPGTGNFMGMKAIVAESDYVASSWNTVRAGVEQAVKDNIQAAREGTAPYNVTNPATPNQLTRSTLNTAAGIAALRQALGSLYGKAAYKTAGDAYAANAYTINLAGLEDYFIYNNNNTPTLADDIVVGFDFAKFEKNTSAFKNQVKDAQDALKNAWRTNSGSVPVAAGLANPVAQSSQTTVSNAEADAPGYAILNSGSPLGAGNAAYVAGPPIQDGPAVSLAAVQVTAKWVLDQEKSWLANAEKRLADASMRLRGEWDKVSQKIELRLGGADRYETAQLIANRYGILYGGVVDPIPGASPMAEAYIANGTRLPDALTAGQLGRGPILLVAGEGDVPEFTKKVAEKLPSFTTNRGLNAFAIGGKVVLPDEQVTKVVNLINAAARNAGVVLGTVPAALGAWNGAPTAGAASTHTIKITNYNASYTYDLVADAANNANFTFAIAGDTITATVANAVATGNTGRVNLRVTAPGKRPTTVAVTPLVCP